MSDIQYKIILALWNEFHEEFKNLSDETQSAFYDRLYSKK